jgi:hypothetical protein
MKISSRPSATKFIPQTVVASIHEWVVKSMHPIPTVRHKRSLALRRKNEVAPVGVHKIAPALSTLLLLLGFGSYFRERVGARPGRYGMQY